MAKYKNKGKRWNRLDLMELRRFSALKLPTSVIAEKLQRPPTSVVSKAIMIGIKLSIKT